MVRSIQIKIILIFMILGIAFIAALGVSFMKRMDYINNEINIGQINTIDDAKTMLSEQTNGIKMITIYGILAFAITSLVVGVFVSKVVISPINYLIKSAQKIISGEEINISELANEKSNTEIDQLVKAFGLVTSELKENLNETTRQKKQIEAILLHMTDGIIAFNLNGEILHINSAAKNLLEINDEDNTFKKVFEKLDLDINLEKIIYLEDWTTSEHKYNIKDTYINMFSATFKDENERIAGVVFVVQDITEQVKLDNMRKEFVADVSHELKTPLTSIMSYTETLQESENITDSQSKFLEVIQTESRKNG